MSFSDAIGQVDQIVQWEQQLAPSTAATETTTNAGAAAGDTASATTGTNPSDANSSTAFADALAEAQAAEGTAAMSTTDPTTSIDAGLLDNTNSSDPLDSTATTGSSDLLGDGDSQLLTTLSALGGTTSSTVSPTSTTTSDSGPAGGTATSAADPRIQALTEEANALVDKPYVWGAGHDGWGPQSGYDCSGFVSAVLHAGGYLSSPQDTTTLPTAAGIESGPGQYVTIYDRDEPGQAGHVIIDINGQFYESGGERGSWGGGGGVAAISTPSACYLASFDRVLHPAGL